MVLLKAHKRKRDRELWTDGCGGYSIHMSGVWSRTVSLKMTIFRSPSLVCHSELQLKRQTEIAIVEESNFGTGFRQNVDNH